MTKFASLVVSGMICASSMAFAQTDAIAVNTVAEVAVPTPWTPEDGDIIDFEVLRKGKPFGRHVLTFTRAADGALTVVNDVDLKVKIGPITAFRYTLDSTERWAGGQLVSMTGNTNNDGKKTSVDAEAVDGKLVVESSLFDGELPAETIPSSHWNILQAYSSQMLSAESGEVLPIEQVNLGVETIEAGGQQIEATHYRLLSDIDVDLWYDDQSRWVKLAFEARGQSIEYVLSELY
ncbi:MAG: DUF6134 family protein [Pseudomonadota bacterium]